MKRQVYEALYSSRGHSIKRLKADAKKVKDAQNLSHIESLNNVAREAGYSDWGELTNQAKNPKRDEFFRSTYEDGEHSPVLKSLYQNFLRDKQFVNSKESYRKFVIHLWNGFVELGMDKFDLDIEILSPDAFLRAIDELRTEGRQLDLLPQNMSDQMLQATIGANRIILGDIYQYITEEIRSGYTIAIVKIISVLSAYALNNCSDVIEEGEFIDLIQEFAVLAELEFTSRNTGLTLELPGTESIFRRGSKFIFSLPTEYKNKFVLNK